MGNTEKFNCENDFINKEINAFNTRTELYQGDCIKVLSTLIQNNVEVDAVITDPPYEISRKNNFQSMGRAGIDFGAWDHDVDLFGYIDSVYKLVKDGGSFIVFCDWRKAGMIAEYCEKVGFLTKDRIQFKKTNPFHPNANRRYASDREDAIWFVKPGKKPFQKWTFNIGENNFLRPEFSAGIARGKNGNLRHPCQKPVSLMEEIIKVHTNVGDTVLDCYMGSGTTGVACRNTGRNFIGIELDSKYFDLAERRIRFEM